ncbi:MAG: hypothetical protein CMH49_05715 [Myxococcales bacterium]|nr:hypothetical protein [Myxococcales bacterium]
MSQEDCIKHMIIRNQPRAFLARWINLLSEVMGEGWKSQRSQRVGYKWISVELGTLGEVSSVGVDTNHFSDHCPKKIPDSLGAHPPNTDLLSRLSKDINCKPRVDRTKLSISTEHHFRSEAYRSCPVIHVKIRIHPMVEFVLKSIEKSLVKPVYNDAYQLSH